MCIRDSPGGLHRAESASRYGPMAGRDPRFPCPRGAAGDPARVAAADGYLEGSTISAPCVAARLASIHRFTGTDREIGTHDRVSGENRRPDAIHARDG